MFGFGNTGLLSNIKTAHLPAYKGKNLKKMKNDKSSLPTISSLIYNRTPLSGLI